MEKLRLRIEELTVETYPTTSEGEAARGTVLGRDSDESVRPHCTRICSQWITCGGTCDC